MRYGFATSAWLAALHGVLMQRVAIQARAGTPTRLSVCEVYVDAPVELAGPTRRLAWSCKAEDGHLDFQVRERDDVDYKVEVDFETVARAAAYDTRGEPARVAELKAMRAEAIAQGRIRVLRQPDPVGPLPGSPDDAGSVHDIMAGLTA